MSLIWEEFKKKHKLKIETDDDVLAVRDQFYEEYWSEVVTDGLTLCNKHHVELHRVYGKVPALSTAQKQKVWVKKKKEKLAGMDSTPTEVSEGSSRFSKFLDGASESRFSQFL